jgi:uncharacterized protein (UPF0128 family)
MPGQPDPKPKPKPLVTEVEQIVIELEQLKNNVVQGSPIHIEELDSITRKVMLLKLKV